MSRSEEKPKRKVLVIGGVVTVLLAGGGVLLGDRLLRDEADAEGASASQVNLTTATAERRTLEEHAELDGTLGYGDVTQLALPSQGTITALAALGSVVERDEPLLEVDAKPVPLLYGERPLWRQLGPGVEDGADVRQLERNLVALGIVSESELTVDKQWTDVTTEAVKDWQASHGREETGIIFPGDVVFMPGAVRVAEHPLSVGSMVGESVLGVTGIDRTVTIDLEATRRGLVEEGQAVTVELPDGTTTAGIVDSIGEVATTGSDDATGGGAGDSDGGGDSEPTIEVTVTLDDPSASGNLDQAPVAVQVVTSATEDVLAVPVDALLATDDASYAVELVRPDGATVVEPVELGAFADGWVEISGNLSAGDEVVVPSD